MNGILESKEFEERVVAVIQEEERRKAALAAEKQAQKDTEELRVFLMEVESYLVRRSMRWRATPHEKELSQKVAKVMKLTLQYRLRLER